MNKEEMKNLLKGFMWGMLLCGLLGLLNSVLCGCSSQRGAVGGTVTVRTDTVYKTRVATDTVRMRDSVYVTERTVGDTVYRDRTTWRWRERVAVRTDTVYKSVLRADTVRVPVPQERKATWWERNVTAPLQSTAKASLIILLAVAFLIWTVRRLMRSKE